MQTLFGAKNQHLILSRKNIIDAVNNSYPETNRNSVIPTDYCYNQTCKGAKATYLFESLGNGMFKVLGSNYPYAGSITWKGKLVGEWRTGSKSPTFHVTVE